MSLITGKASENVFEYLTARRSCPLKMMGDDGPSKEELDEILKAASRIPDHGKLFPWYFVALQGKEREDAGKLLSDAYKTVELNASPAKLELEGERFLRAPTVVFVISRARPGKHPYAEQFLSAGALCYNLCLAANAKGYGTNWLSEWYSTNVAFKTAFGLDDRDHIAGVIYMGNVLEQPEERPRPDIAHLTTYWKPHIKLSKGDEYDHEGFEIPPRRL